MNELYTEIEQVQSSAWQSPWLAIDCQTRLWVIMLNTAKKEKHTNSYKGVFDSIRADLNIMYNQQHFIFNIYLKFGSFFPKHALLTNLI